MSYDPEIVVLYCQHRLAENANLDLSAQDARGMSVRPKMIPCSSKVDVPHLLKILEQGADGVELVACPENACRFLVGSLKAEKRIERASSLLDLINMGGQRLGLSRKEILSAEDLLALAEARAQAVRPLGPNPMKTQPDE